MHGTGRIFLEGGRSRNVHPFIGTRRFIAVLTAVLLPLGSAPIHISAVHATPNPLP